MQLNTVVLPAPLGPISAVISPLCAAKQRSLIATKPPKRMLRCSTCRIGAKLEDAVAFGHAPVIAASWLARLIRGAPARAEAGRSPLSARGRAGSEARVGMWRVLGERSCR